MKLQKHKPHLAKEIIFHREKAPANSSATAKLLELIYKIALFSSYSPNLPPSNSNMEKLLKEKSIAELNILVGLRKLGNCLQEYYVEKKKTNNNKEEKTK